MRLINSKLNSILVEFFIILVSTLHSLYCHCCHSIVLYFILYSYITKERNIVKYINECKLVIITVIH